MISPNSINAGPQEAVEETLMSHLSGSLFALAFIAGVSAAPSSALAEKGAKAPVVRVAEQSGGTSDFEENRRAHAQKSKENNEKKGAN